MEKFYVWMFYGVAMVQKCSFMEIFLARSSWGFGDFGWNKALKVVVLYGESDDIVYTKWFCFGEISTFYFVVLD